MHRKAPKTATRADHQAGYWPVCRAVHRTHRLADTVPLRWP
jgi:hypothetical protein